MSSSISTQIERLEQHLPLNQVPLSQLVSVSHKMHQQIQSSSVDRRIVSAFNRSLTDLRNFVLLDGQLHLLERQVEQDSSTFAEKCAAFNALQAAFRQIPPNFHNQPRYQDMVRKLCAIRERLTNPPSFLGRHRGRLSIAAVACGIARFCLDQNWIISLSAGALLGILLPQRQAAPPPLVLPPEPVHLPPEPAAPELPPQPATTTPVMRAAPQRAPTAQTGLLVGQQASSYDQQWINFFMGTGRDDLGRTLDEILNRDDHWFESQHDFIQRLFLNSHQSGNGGPTLTPGLKHAFLQSSPLRANLLRCFDRMLTFYGFTWNASRQIVRGRDFDTKPWIRATNRVHNHQRITRILASLKNLGLGSEADAFYNALVNTFGRGAPYAAFVFDDTFSGHWTPALN